MVQEDKDSLGKPVSVWECDIFESTGFSLIPIEFIVCHTISLIDTMDDGSHALLVCPCINF